MAAYVGVGKSFKSYDPAKTEPGGSVDISPNLAALVYTVPPGDPALRTGSGFSTGYTDNRPISMPARDLGLGFRDPTFFDDYYERIHILPSSFALGNLLSSQSRNVEVWNAFSTAQTLTSIDAVGAEGIALTEPVVPPTVFAQYEARVYELNISTNGPPVVNAVFTFNFTSESPTLTVTGRRVVIWPFEPDTEHTERLEWKTDIIDAYSQEQRLALRPAPRQSFSYTFELDTQQFSRAKAISAQWAHRVYGIPVWSESRHVGALASGISFVPFDTSYADHRDDGLLLLWDDDLTFLAVETTTVDADGINLKIPLTSAFANAYVAPVRFARTLAGTQFARSHNERIIAQATFLVTDNFDLGDEGSYPTYRSVPVLTDRTVVVEDVSERVARAMDVFDNGSGELVVDTQKNWVRFDQMLGFTKRGRQKVWDLRRWLHARRGKQKSLWLPSWNRDMELLQTVDGSSTSMLITNIGYALYYGVKDIMVVMSNGTLYFNRTTGAADNGDGTENVALEASFGVPINPVDVAFICFLSHVRLNSDAVTMRHSAATRVDVTVPVTEIPES